MHQTTLGGHTIPLVSLPQRQVHKVHKEPSRHKLLAKKLPEYRKRKKPTTDTKTQRILQITAKRYGIKPGQMWSTKAAEYLLIYHNISVGP